MPSPFMFIRGLLLVFSIFMLAGCGNGGGSSSTATTSNVISVNQGADWSAENQAEFYSKDQGSWIIPYAWAVALKLPDGQSFLGSLTSTYGYLPNPVSPSNPEGLPVGFLVANPGTNNQQFSINCAACHTRQIQVSGVNYRVDGGPAFSNLYAFFQGLDQAVSYTLSNQAAFNAFQAAVQVEANELRAQLTQWYKPYNSLMSKALPTTPWGIGRADAVGMIQNRLSGLDIGPESNSYVIEGNIAVAAQPVRYPFLWNSWIQDFTQWAGTDVNGNPSYALERNSGQAIGVFAHFFPQADPAVSGGVNFKTKNSIKYDNLLRIEQLVRQIGRPQWPWAINQQLANQGWALFEANCASCHKVQPGAPRPGNSNTWLTQVLDIGTDSSYYSNFNIPTISSGILSGITPPYATNPVPASGAASISLVTAANVSALKQWDPNIDLSIRPLTRPCNSGATRSSNAPNGNGNCFAYESKVIQGVWASAPFLHNGSVPTLAALLSPQGSRPSSFQVGPVYDTTNIGLADTQPGGSATVRVTTDCSIQVGNSNCGHEYGTTLSPNEKSALLEYLKKL